MQLIKKEKPPKYGGVSCRIPYICYYSILAHLTESFKYANPTLTLKFPYPLFASPA